MTGEDGAMYRVIGTARSRAFRVLWALEELGLAYEHEPAAPRSDAVRALNPAGKVPVLVVAGDGVEAALTDSTAIVTFLADRHGGLTHPAGTLERARQDALTQMILDEFDAVLWMAARHSFVLPEERRVPAVKDSLKWEFARSAEALAARLGAAEFLAGERLTVPDILAAHCLGWAHVAGFPPAPPPLAAWRKRMATRPAFQRAMARG